MSRYNTTSASQIIDVATIANGCAIIDAAAEKFTTCANLVESASDICNSNALAVDGTTMQPQLDADAQYIKSMTTAIKDFTLELKRVAYQIFYAQHTELTEYQAEQERLAAQQAAQQSTQSNG